MFSGIGGIDLAAEWAGFEVVGQVEWDEFCRQVLEKHWPDVPKWRDICEFTGEQFRGETGIQKPDLISGGFPCQPYSIAGERKGEKDDRHLWPEMFRVISELRPTWVLGENVAHFKNMGLDQALSDLEGEGYATRTFDIPAMAVDAEHKRHRLFIVAHAGSFGSRGRGKTQCGAEQRDLVQGKQKRREVWSETARRIIRSLSTQKTLPRYLRSDYGFSDWVDRVKSLGNAVVPQQVYPILKAIALIEGGQQ